MEKQKNVRFVDMTGNTTNSSVSSTIDVGHQESRPRALKTFATKRDMANSDDDEKKVRQKRSKGVETSSTLDVDSSKTSGGGGGSVVRITDVSHGGNAKAFSKVKAVSVEDHAAALSSEEQNVGFGVRKLVDTSMETTTPNRVNALFYVFFCCGVVLLTLYCKQSLDVVIISAEQESASATLQKTEQPTETTGRAQAEKGNVDVNHGDDVPKKHHGQNMTSFTTAAGSRTASSSEIQRETAASFEQSMSSTAQSLGTSMVTKQGQVSALLAILQLFFTLLTCITSSPRSLRQFLLNRRKPCPHRSMPGLTTVTQRRVMCLAAEKATF